MDSLLVALAIDLLGVQCVSLSRKAFEILDKTFRFLEEFLLETNCSVVSLRVIEIKIGFLIEDELLGKETITSLGHRFEVGAMLV